MVVFEEVGLRIYKQMVVLIITKFITMFVMTLLVELFIVKVE